jgi:ribosomal protein S27E
MFWIILIIILSCAFVGIAYTAYRMGRKGRVPPGADRKGRYEDEDEDLDDLDMEDDIESMDMDDDIETLDMGDDIEDVDLEMAPMSVGAAAVPAARDRARKPVRTVRCPGCKHNIKIYREEQTDIECPECGKKGKLKPMAKKSAPPAPPKKAPAPPRKTEKPAKPAERVPLKYLTCSGCRGKVPVHSAKRPLRISCPSCGKSGTLKK